MVFFHSFFILSTTIRPKSRIFIDLFILFAHNHLTKTCGHPSFIFFVCARLFDQKLGSLLIYFFHLHTIIRPIWSSFIYSSFCAQPFDQRLESIWSTIQSISPYSVRMRENTDQKKLRIWTLFTQCFKSKFNRKINPSGVR